MSQQRQTYNRAKIVAALDVLLADMGEHLFSTVGVMEIEKSVRQLNGSGQLPGKTLLRAIINEYRSSRWPELVRKKAGRRT